MRKKTAMSLDARYTMMIENAFYMVNPPETTAAARETLPPLHEYIQRLIYNDLSKSTTEKAGRFGTLQKWTKHSLAIGPLLFQVLKQVRKLDWKDRDTAEFAVRALAAVWNVKYYNIRYAASLMAGLVSYHDWLGPRIVDAVLEDVRLHLETNDPRYNQRRVAVVKFLAELYNYRLVDSGVVFKVLYSMVSFGASTGADAAASSALLDPPDHMLRIRLVCVLLDTCGVYFNAGGSKKKLDYFLVYFQVKSGNPLQPPGHTTKIGFLFQRYYWRKKSSSYWKADCEEDGAIAEVDEGKTKKEAEDPPLSRFPIAVENLVAETLTTLRPKMKLFKSLEEAEQAAEKVDKEMMKSLQVSFYCTFTIRGEAFLNHSFFTL